MLVVATDWATISLLATAAGTLVLATATFASVRSANRSARIAEAALQEQRRPVLAPSRLDDPLQKLMFVEGHWVSAAGGRAVAEHIDGRIYLAISLRNVGAGIAVCQGWVVRAELGSPRTLPNHASEDEFRLQTRDLYIPAGDIGMWQGALRDPDDPLRVSIAEAIDAREPITVELLYTDQVGGQRTITRFGLSPVGDDSWLAFMARNWYLEWDGPRPETDVFAAAAVIQREQEAADRRASELSSVPDDNAGGRFGLTWSNRRTQGPNLREVVAARPRPEQASAGWTQGTPASTRERKQGRIALSRDLPRQRRPGRCRRNKP